MLITFDSFLNPIFISIGEYILIFVFCSIILCLKISWLLSSFCKFFRNIISFILLISKIIPICCSAIVFLSWSISVLIHIVVSIISGISIFSWLSYISIISIISIISKVSIISLILSIVFSFIFVILSFFKSWLIGINFFIVGW